MKNITSSKFFIPGFALVVFLLVAIVLLVRNDNVPSDAVAKVAGDTIPKTQFNKTLVIFERQNQGTTGAVQIPDPPAFTKCIAAKRTKDKKTLTSTLKNQCEKDWNDAKTQVMTSLIQQKWYQLEAKDRGIVITPAMVQQRFQALKQQSFPKAADYQKFLAQTGQTQDDINRLVLTSMYQEKINAQANKVPAVTQKQIEDEYNKNKKNYSQPASRDLNLVFNAKKAQADAAKAALNSGTAFPAVAKKYSQDTASKQNGGKFPGVTKGQFESTLDNAVFSAKKGAIVGPIKTQYGYYVFQVTKITPAKQQTLQQASAQIKQTLQSQKQQAATTQFQQDFQDKWRKKTVCAKLYLVELCRNGPKPKKQPQPTVGG